MKTISEIDVYDKSEVFAGDYDTKRKIMVESDWNSHDLIILIVEGERFRVSGKELKKAIESAQRAYKYS